MPVRGAGFEIGWEGMLGRTGKCVRAPFFAGFLGIIAQEGGFVRIGGVLTPVDGWPALGLTDTALIFGVPNVAVMPAMDFAATLLGRRSCWPTNMVYGGPNSFKRANSYMPTLCVSAISDRVSPRFT